jgi:hypothetical protein
VLDLGGSVKDATVRLLGPVLDVDVVSLAVSLVELTGPPDLGGRVEHLLPPVGEPANAAGNGKEDRVEAGRNNMVSKEMAE